MNWDKRPGVELKEDVASGELMLPIPQSLLTELDWYEGTELEFTLEGNEIILRELTSWLTLFITSMLTTNA